jgi:predicted esterase
MGRCRSTPASRPRQLASTGVPVIVAQGEHDAVIPRELLDRTWDYLLGESGAPTIARRDPVGHSIAPERSRPWPAGCPNA